MLLPLVVEVPEVRLIYYLLTIDAYGLVVGFDVARTGVASVYVPPSTVLREDTGLRVS